MTASHPTYPTYKPGLLSHMLLNMLPALRQPAIGQHYPPSLDAMVDISHLVLAQRPRSQGSIYLPYSSPAKSAKYRTHCPVSRKKTNRKTGDSENKKQEDPKGDQRNEPATNEVHQHTTVIHNKSHNFSDDAQTTTSKRTRTKRTKRTTTTLRSTCGYRFLFPLFCLRQTAPE